MSDLSKVSPEEVLGVVQELFPGEFRIAVLTLTNRRQAARVAALEEALKAALPSPEDSGNTLTPDT